MIEASFYFSQSPTVIHVSGLDHLDFLHRLTSQSFKTRKVGDFFYGACLRANAGVVGLFGALVRETDVLLVPLGRSVDPILKFLEHYHFGEDVRFELKMEFAVMHRIGESLGGLGAPTGALRFPGPLMSVLAADLGLIQNDVCLVPRAKMPPAESLSAMRELDARSLSDIYCWYGLPEAGVDLLEENILIEAPLDSFVHRTKGCYPGQEVIERIYTYGNVAKYVLNLEMAESAQGLSELPSERELKTQGDDGAEIKSGVLRSLRTNPYGKPFVAAQVQRVPFEKRKTFFDFDLRQWKASELSHQRIAARSK